MDYPAGHPTGLVNRCLVKGVTADSLLAVRGEDEAISAALGYGQGRLREWD